MNREEFYEWLDSQGLLLKEGMEIPDLREGHEGEILGVITESEQEEPKPAPQGEEALKYMWESQYYEFGNHMKELNDLFMSMKLPYEKKKGYLNTIRDLYRNCVNETLTWEMIQPALFTESDMMKVLEAQAGAVGKKLHEDIAFQFVCIQMAQWEREEAKG